MPADLEASGFLASRAWTSFASKEWVSLFEINKKEINNSVSIVLIPLFVSDSLMATVWELSNCVDRVHYSSH